MIRVKILRRLSWSPRSVINFSIEVLFKVFELGVRELIFSKKYSKTYFLINSSFIVFAIDLIFFSKIAIDDGLLLVCFL